MSRSYGPSSDYDINTSKPDSLSVDDRIYLADRGVLPAGAKLPTAKEREKAASGPQQVGVISENEGADAGDDNGGDDNGGETPYDDWSGDELREELESRDLSKSGTNAEMRQRLVEDDESELVED